MPASSFGSIGKDVILHQKTRDHGINPTFGCFLGQSDSQQDTPMYAPHPGIKPAVFIGLTSFASVLKARRRFTMQALLALTIASPTLAFSDSHLDKQEQLVAHGQYIVERVGMCADCHTPRDSQGKPLPGQSLHGAPIRFTPQDPIPGWTPASPKIAGLPAGYTEAQLAMFLETGRTRTGGLASPPMPPYRMDEHDAQSVAAYLKTLK
jgi:mono/diheme cytochrome c family protein